MARQFSESDPYEEWKALGRPGGDFRAWMAAQAPPQAPAGPPPPPAPPAGPGSGRPSSAAQAFFDQQSPEDQAKIRETWGTSAPKAGPFGLLNRVRDAQFMDQWYQNAMGAGAVPRTPGTGMPNAPAGPGAFNQGWMDEALRAYAAGQRGSDPTRTPGFNPATFRQQYAGMQGGNRSEDLARFSDETLAGWMPFYNPATGKYRSMRGAEGWFDKPTDCPPGMVPSGPNETDPCISPGGQAAPKAPPGAGPGAGTGAGPYGPGMSFIPPVTDTSGSQPVTGKAAQPPLPPGKSAAPQSFANTLAGFQSASPPMPPPGQSSLANILAPLQSPGLPGPPMAGMPFNFGLGTGWGSSQGGLAGMLAQQQRKGRPNRWF